jgi:hypothetical protein
MKMQLLAVTLSLLQLNRVLAFPSSSQKVNELDFKTLLAQHPYIAPGPNDIRGACPGMNTLANHGFIHRNGSDITAKMILDAMEMVYKFTPTNAVRLTVTEGVGASATLNSEGVAIYNLTGAAFHRLSWVSLFIFLM